MGWDDSPLIGPRALLTTISGGGINGGGQISFKQLNMIKMILKSQLGGYSAKELDIAKDIETNEGLKQAEVQQAVVGTFLYSQPVGRTARFAILKRMVMPTKAKRLNWRMR